jgi:hypothetical protein
MKLAVVVTTLVGLAAMVVADPRPSVAMVYAAQLYPYCQTYSSGAGMNCYIRSREQCEFRELCIRNPWYLGTEGAQAWKRKNKPEWRWW